MVAIDCADLSPPPGCEPVDAGDGPGASPASGIVDNIYQIEIDEETSGSDCSASQSSENKSLENTG
jgi:hypothetical protein